MVVKHSGFFWGGLDSGVFRRKASRRSGLSLGEWEVGKNDEILGFECLFLQQFSFFFLDILSPSSFPLKDCLSGYATEAKHVQ